MSRRARRRECWGDSLVEFTGGMIAEDGTVWEVRLQAQERRQSHRTPKCRSVSTLSCGVGGGALEFGAIPVGEIGAGVVGGLAEIEERLFGGVGETDIVVHQEEFAFLGLWKAL